MHSSSWALVIATALCGVGAVSFSVYHASWSASSSQADGTVVVAGRIPAVEFLPPHSKGARAQVDTFAFRFHESGEHVPVLFKVDPRTELWDGIVSVEGDLSLYAAICYGFAIAGLVLAVAIRLVSGLPTVRSPRSLHGPPDRQ